MPDPLNTTQLDLQNLPPEQAAAMARAQQQALLQQQQHALVGMLSAMPEAQKMGQAEYEQAGKERAGGQATAANVLRHALGQKEADLRLKELQNQLMFQKGELENTRAGLGLTAEQQRFERQKVLFDAQEKLAHTQAIYEGLKKIGTPDIFLGELKNKIDAYKNTISQFGQTSQTAPAPVPAAAPPSALPLTTGKGKKAAPKAPVAAVPSVDALRAKYGKPPSP